jgi:hypothetical protein
MMISFNEDKMVKPRPIIFYAIFLVALLAAIVLIPR